MGGAKGSGLFGRGCGWLGKLPGRVNEFLGDGDFAGVGRKILKGWKLVRDREAK